MTGNPARDPERTLDFVGHLVELRNRVLWVLVLLLPLSAAGWFAYPYVNAAIVATVGEKLYLTTVAEGFSVRFSMSLLVGFVLVLPFAVFQAFAFLFPGLKPVERRWLVGLTVASTLLMGAGVAYGYELILPVSVKFLMSRAFSPDGIGRVLYYSDYLGFFLQFLVAFGIAFQLPIAVLFIVRSGLLTVGAVAKATKGVVVGIFVVAAIITPPDIFSQLCVALPMVALYFVSLLIARLLVPRKR